MTARKLQLEPQARQALGSLSPESLKDALEMSLAGAMEEYYQAAEELLKQAQWGENLDLDDVLSEVQALDPVDLSNQLVYANPQLNLEHLAKLPPLEPLQAVLRMLTSSDRFQARMT